MKRKGQAAMEFLMTYGWAILAAIIVIAVIAIYFRPGNVVGQTAIFNPPLTALSQAISDSSNNAVIELRNSGAETITPTNITWTTNSPAGATVCGLQAGTLNMTTDAAGATLNTTSTWGPGVTRYLRCFNVALTNGESYSADIVITYTGSTGTLPKTATGTISGKVQA